MASERSDGWAAIERTDQATDPTQPQPNPNPTPTPQPPTNQVLVYLSYMSIFATGLFFAMGAVGFVASGLFVLAIMKAVKAE